MEKLRTYEYGIPLLRVGHGIGPHIFTFYYCLYLGVLIPNKKRKFWGMKNSIFPSEMMQFRGISRTGEAIQGALQFSD